MDAPVAPVRVLAAQAKGEAADLGGGGWTTGAPSRVGPTPGDSAPVPREQRGRLDHECLPPAARQPPAERSQHAAVDIVETRSRHLAGEDRDLVTKHDDLDCDVDVAAGTKPHELEEPTERPVREAKSHDLAMLAEHQGGSGQGHDRVSGTSRRHGRPARMRSCGMATSRYCTTSTRGAP